MRGYLGVDVADQVGVRIDVLDQRERIIGLGLCGMLLEDLNGTVATELG